MILTRKIPLLILLSAGAVLVWFSQPGSAVEPAAVRVASTVTAASTGKIGPKPKGLFRGVGSCAASNCHGGDPDNGIVGAEYSIWVQQDKHAEGYSVLLNAESKQMAMLLKLDKEAHEAPLCLNCHSPQRFEPKPEGETSYRHLLDGVGCESCHGGAEGWLGEHVRWTESTPTEDKLHDDTDNLWTRAQLCADCHVGAPGRDVNHDLYAAGHPRLFFEFSAFMANMPIHWEVARERERADWSERPGIEASTWAIGQIATAEAAVDLLVYRADRAKQETFKYTGSYPSGQVPPVWPEYSETACFACHHDLSSPSWRQQRGFAGRRPGQNPWGTWTFPLVDVVTQQALQRDLRSGGHSLTTMQTVMAEYAPSVDDVIKTGTQLQKFLLEAGCDFPRSENSRGRQEVSLTKKQIAGLRSAVATAGPGVVKENWDGATQVYLALAVLLRAHRDQRGLAVSDPDDEVLKALMDVRCSLEFPPDFDSPRDYSPPPIKKTIKRIEDALNRISTSLDAEE